MNSQNLILLVIGLFVSVIVAALSYYEFQEREHDPTEPRGLIWHVNTAFDRLRGFEALVEVEARSATSEAGIAYTTALLEARRELPEGGDAVVSSPFKVLVRYVNDAQPALALTYPEGDDDTSNDRLLVVDGAELSSFSPIGNTTVSRHWPARLQLIEMALGAFHLKRVEADREANRVKLRVAQDVAGLPPGLFRSSIVCQTTLTGCTTTTGTLCFNDGLCSPSRNWSFVSVQDPTSEGSIQGAYILEVRSAETGLLEAMVWVDGGDYFIRKVVHFVDGKRASSLRVQRMTPKPDLSRDDLVALPRGAEGIEG